MRTKVLFVNMEGSNNSLGARMAEERARLGLSQQDVANACDGTREAVGKYERNVNVPGGEMLRSLAKIGMDIQYILTGTRSKNLDRVAEEAGTYKAEKGVGALSKEEEKVVEMYRHLQPQERTRLKAIIDSLVSAGIKNKDIG